MPVIEREETPLHKAVEWFYNWIQNSLILPIHSQIGYTPSSLRATMSLLDRLQDATSKRVGPPSIETLSEAYRPLLKRILLSRRLDRARDIENKSRLVHHEGIRQELRPTLDPLDALLTHALLAKIEPAPIPRLGEFLTLAAIESTRKRVPDQRTFDDKFGILFAPSLFLTDLAYHREACFERGIPILVAYIDIDDLKSLNKANSETIVDLRILPSFMRELEAAVYQHGCAYRLGGDEYGIILPNATEKSGTTFLDDLRVRLSALRYPQAIGTTTVSIGMCVVDPDCFVTDLEVLLTANRTKDSAKDRGKNRIGIARIDRNSYTLPQEVTFLE